MRTRGLGVALGGALLAVAATSPAQSEEYAANIFFGPELTLTKFAYTEFAKRVAEATNGEISFKVYTGGVLIPPRASMEGLADNIAQVGYHAGTYTPDKIPRHNLISELSFVATDYFVTALASTEISFTMPELEQEWKANGVVYGGGYSTLPYVLQCNTKIETLADVKGKRLRMPGAIWDRWATAMGAVSVNVPSSEIFTGLGEFSLLHTLADVPVPTMSSTCRWGSTTRASTGPTTWTSGAACRSSSARRSTSRWRGRSPRRVWSTRARPRPSSPRRRRRRA